MKPEVKTWIKSKKLESNLLALAKLKLKLEKYFEDTEKESDILDEIVCIGAKCNEEHSIHLAKLIIEHFADRNYDVEEVIDVAKRVYEYISTIKIPTDYFVVARLEENDE
jgi:hypothetical protein